MLMPTLPVKDVINPSGVSRSKIKPDQTIWLIKLVINQTGKLNNLKQGETAGFLIREWG